MKIDESCLNHNALRLITELTSVAFDDMRTENKEVTMAILMGEIAGICDITRELKEVLKQ